MTNLVNFVPAHVCPNCGKEYGIKCITDNGAAIPLSDIYNDPTILDRYTIRNMRCYGCGKEYIINWMFRGQGNPYPVIRY